MADTLENGAVSGHGRHPGAVRALRCNPTFWLNGPAALAVCHTDGQWSDGGAGRCVRTSAPTASPTQEFEFHTFAHGGTDYNAFVLPPANYVSDSHYNNVGLAVAACEAALSGSKPLGNYPGPRGHSCDGRVVRSLPSFNWDGSCARRESQYCFTDIDRSALVGNSYGSGTADDECLGRTDGSGRRFSFIGNRISWNNGVGIRLVCIANPP